MGIAAEWIWLALFVLFVIVELASPALLTIWFAPASLGSALLSYLGFSLTVQVVFFFVSSILLLIFTRPLLKKYYKRHEDAAKTNVDSLLGKKALVTKEISEHEFGQVKLDGQLWSAISENREVIYPIGAEVYVVSVSGVKVVVKAV